MLLFSSCGGDEEVRIPTDVIEKEKFSEIMVEVTLIEAVKNLSVSKELKNKDSFSAYYNGVWEKFDIDEEAFKRSFDFYKTQADMMSDIYKKAAVEIKVYEDQVKAEKKSKQEERDKKQEAKRDSIARKTDANRPRKFLGR